MRGAPGSAAPGVLTRCGSEFRDSTCFLDRQRGTPAPEHLSPCRRTHTLLIAQHTDVELLRLDLPQAVGRFADTVSTPEAIAECCRWWPQLSGPLAKSGAVVHVCMRRLYHLLQMEANSDLPEELSKAASYVADSYIPLVLLLSGRHNGVQDSDTVLRNCLPTLWSGLLEDDVPMFYQAMMEVSLSGDSTVAENGCWITKFVMAHLPQRHPALRREQLLDQAASDPASSSSNNVFLYWMITAFHLGLFSETCTCRPAFWTRCDVYHTLVCQPRADNSGLIAWLRQNPTASTLAAREIYINTMQVLGFEEALNGTVRWSSFTKSTSNFANLMRKLTFKALQPEPRAPLLEDRLNFSSQSYHGSISTIHRELALDLKWLPSPRGHVFSQQTGTGGIPTVDFRTAHFSTTGALIWWACTLTPRHQYMEPTFLLSLKQLPELVPAEVDRFCQAMRQCIFRGVHRAIRTAFRACSYNSPFTASLLYLFVRYRDIQSSVCLVRYSQPLEVDGVRTTLWQRQRKAILTSRYIEPAPGRDPDEEIPPHLYTLYACTQCRSIKHDLGVDEDGRPPGNKRKSAAARKAQANPHQDGSIARTRNQRFAQGVDTCLLAQDFKTRTCEAKAPRKHQPKGAACDHHKPSVLHEYMASLCSHTPLASFDLRGAVLYWFGSAVTICTGCGVFMSLNVKSLSGTDFLCTNCRLYAQNDSATVPRGFTACRVCANTVTLHWDAREERIKPRHERVLEERGESRPLPVCTQCHTALRRHPVLTLEQATCVQMPPALPKYGEIERSIQTMMLQLLPHCE